MTIVPELKTHWRLGKERREEGKLYQTCLNTRSTFLWIRGLMQLTFRRINIECSTVLTHACEWSGMDLLKKYSQAGWKGLLVGEDVNHLNPQILVQMSPHLCSFGLFMHSFAFSSPSSIPPSSFPFLPTFHLSFLLVPFPTLITDCQWYHWYVIGISRGFKSRTIDSRDVMGLPKPTCKASLVLGVPVYSHYHFLHWPRAKENTPQPYASILSTHSSMLSSFCNKKMSLGKSSHPSLWDFHQSWPLWLLLEQKGKRDQKWHLQEVIHSQRWESPAHKQPWLQRSSPTFNTLAETFAAHHFDLTRYNSPYARECPTEREKIHKKSLVAMFYC